MRCLLLLLCISLYSSILRAQEVLTPPTEVAVPIVVDSLYREDQFYVGVTFNILFNRPPDINQSGFSGGGHFGFTRDMPINRRRNLAIGLGIGYSGNTYNHNLAITKQEASESTIFRPLPTDGFSTNRFTTHLIEMPFELRYRTSTPTVRKFWRVYSGLRLGYMYQFRATVRQNGTKIAQTNIAELNPFRLGATFTFGFNTFNFHFYYSLNSFFDEGTVLQDTAEPVEITTLKIGLMFYIL